MCVRYTCVCVGGGALTKGAKSWLVDVKPECQGDRVAQPHHGRVWRQQDSFQLLRTSCQRDVVYMGSEAQRSHQTTEQVGIYFLHPVLTQLRRPNINGQYVSDASLPKNAK